MANLEKVEEDGSTRDSQAEASVCFGRSISISTLESCRAKKSNLQSIGRVARGLCAAAGGYPQPLDVGGDKPSTASRVDPSRGESVSGPPCIRLCLDHPEMFKEQLRAILRASAVGNVRIMYPMIKRGWMSSCEPTASLRSQEKSSGSATWPSTRRSRWGA